MRWLLVFALIRLGSACALDHFALPSEDDLYDEREEQIVEELENLITTGEPSESLRSFGYLDLMVSDVFRNRYRRAKDETVCLLCRGAARVLIGYRRMGATREDLVYAANQICTNAKIASKRVCKGAIDLNIDIFLYIIDHKSELSPSKVCSILAQPSGCKATRHHVSKWRVNVAPGPKIYPDLTQKKVQDAPMRILHFTDIHYDDIYKVGGNAMCDEPLCCGDNQGEAATAEASAGTWGDYRYCDTPWHAVLDLMNETQKREYDIVYYTGDTINHRVWETSQQKNIYNIKKMNALLKETFGSVPFYPILGNHEPNPLDTFSPSNIPLPELSTQWLYDLSAEDWAYWLPNSTMETIRKGGYYTVLVKPGFRIIALNSNVAYTFNWWLLYNDEDPYGQLQWLADTLAEAEKAGEMVHILSHVPTGDDTCLIRWSHEFGRIVQRFHHIIAVQINGHTHFDEFNVFYDEENSNEAISLALNGGSVTTYFSLNPNYRILSANPNNYKIEDYEEYIFNMTEANINGFEVPPKWFKLYSFKEAYGISDMTNLTQVDQVVKRIASDESYFNDYFRFKVREGDPFMVEGCDRTCQEDNICRLVTTEYRDDKKCLDLIQSSFLNPK